MDTVLGPQDIDRLAKIVLSQGVFQVTLQDDARHALEVLEQLPDSFPEIREYLARCVRSIQNGIQPKDAVRSLFLELDIPLPDIVLHIFKSLEIPEISAREIRDKEKAAALLLSAVPLPSPARDYMQCMDFLFGNGTELQACGLYAISLELGFNDVQKWRRVHSLFQRAIRASGAAIVKQDVSVELDADGLHALNVICDMVEGTHDADHMETWTQRIVLGTFLHRSAYGGLIALVADAFACAYYLPGSTDRVRISVNAGALAAAVHAGLLFGLVMVPLTGLVYQGQMFGFLAFVIENILTAVVVSAAAPAIRLLRESLGLTGVAGAIVNIGLSLGLLYCLLFTGRAPEHPAAIERENVNLATFVGDVQARNANGTLAEFTTEQLLRHGTTSVAESVNPNSDQPVTMFMVAFTNKTESQFADASSAVGAIIGAAREKHQERIQQILGKAPTLPTFVLSISRQPVTHVRPVLRLLRTVFRAAAAFVRRRWWTRNVADVQTALDARDAYPSVAPDNSMDAIRVNIGGLEDSLYRPAYSTVRPMVLLDVGVQLNANNGIEFADGGRIRLSDLELRTTRYFVIEPALTLRYGAGPAGRSQSLEGNGTAQVTSYMDFNLLAALVNANRGHIDRVIEKMKRYNFADLVGLRLARRDCTLITEWACIDPERPVVMSAEHKALLASALFCSVIENVGRTTIAESSSEMPLAYVYRDGGSTIGESVISRIADLASYIARLRGGIDLLQGKVVRARNYINNSQPAEPGWFSAPTPIRRDRKQAFSGVDVGSLVIAGSAIGLYQTARTYAADTVEQNLDVVQSYVDAPVDFVNSFLPRNLTSPDVKGSLRATLIGSDGFNTFDTRVAIGGEVVLDLALDPLIQLIENSACYDLPDTSIATIFQDAKTSRCWLGARLLTGACAAALYRTSLVDGEGLVSPWAVSASMAHYCVNRLPTDLVVGETVAEVATGSLAYVTQATMPNALRSWIMPRVAQRRLFPLPYEAPEGAPAQSTRMSAGDYLRRANDYLDLSDVAVDILDEYRRAGRSVYYTLGIPTKAEAAQLLSQMRPEDAPVHVGYNQADYLLAQRVCLEYDNEPDALRLWLYIKRTRTSRDTGRWVDTALGGWPKLFIGPWASVLYRALFIGIEWRRRYVTCQSALDMARNDAEWNQRTPRGEELERLTELVIAFYQGDRTAYRPAAI